MSTQTVAASTSRLPLWLKLAYTAFMAVLIPVYGEKQIESEQPFKAVLENGVWTVDGTLHCPDGKGGATTMCFGGTAEVKLSKTDGRILKMIHYK